MESNTNGKHVVVVGAGLAGLEAARRLVLAGLGVTLIEREARIGGRAITAYVEGLEMDQGAQFISAFYHETLGLISELGLHEDLVYRSQTASVLRGGRIRGIWPPQVLYRDHAISALTKLRLLGILPGLVWHWRHLDIADLGRSVVLGDLPAAKYLSSVVGNEALEYFFAPLVRGLLYWDIEGTSKEVLLSILKAFATEGKACRLRGGMSSLTAAMCRGESMIEHDLAVQSVRISATGEIEVLGVQNGVKREFAADAAVIATTADAASEMCSWLSPEAKGFLSSVAYSKTTVITYEVDNTKDYPSGVILFSTEEVADLASVNPFEGSTSNGRRMLRVFLSDTGMDEYGSLGDDEMATIVLDRIRALIGRKDWMARAECAHVKRWQMALPKYEAGYVNKVLAFREAVSARPMVVFAGDYLDGPYVDGAIRSGAKAAETLIARVVHIGGT